MSDFASALRLTRPLVLAPMAGEVGTPALTAAVSEAGGLGSLGAAYLTPAQIREAGKAVRALTSRPFALNLFAPAPLPSPTPEAVAAACRELAPLHAELDLPAPTLPVTPAPDFGEQWEAVLEVAPTVFSFTFGVMPPEVLSEAHKRGLLTIGTATSLSEAQELADTGVTALTLQGREAGGHWGGWQTAEPLGLTTLELVREVSGRVRLPLIAAGGLMTADDVQAALRAGASLVQCGTAFLRAHEAGTSAAYRSALTEPHITLLTRAFSGRPARGLPNRVTAELTVPLPFPLQNALTRPLRSAAAAHGEATYLSLWAGEGYLQAQSASAAAIAEALCPLSPVLS